MASLWNRLFSHGPETKNCELERTEQSVNSHQGAPRNSISIPSLMRSKRKDKHRETPIITCQERVHYPVYNPNDPRHNPELSRFSGSRGRSSSQSHGQARKRSSSMTSPAKSLRHARSTLINLTGTFKLKKVAKRRAIPIEPDDISSSSSRRQNVEDVIRGTSGFDASAVHHSLPLVIPVPPPFRKSSDMNHSTSMPISQLPQSVKKRDSLGRDSIPDPSMEENAMSVSKASDQTTRPTQNTTDSTTFSENAEQKGMERESSSFHYEDIRESLAFLSANDPNAPFSSKASQATTSDYDSPQRSQKTIQTSFLPIQPLPKSECPTEVVDMNSPINDISSSPESTLTSSASAASPALNSHVASLNVRAQDSPIPFAHPSEIETASQVRTHKSKSDLLQPTLPGKLGKFWLDCRKRSLTSQNQGISEVSTESDSDFGFEMYRTHCHEDGNTSLAAEDSLLISWLESMEKFSPDDECSRPQSASNHKRFPFNPTSLNANSNQPSPNISILPSTTQWNHDHATEKSLRLNSVLQGSGLPPSGSSIPYDRGRAKSGRESMPEPDINNSPALTQTLGCHPDARSCIGEDVEQVNGSNVANTQEDHGIGPKLRSIHPVKFQLTCLPSHLRYIVEAIDRDSGLEIDGAHEPEKHPKPLYPLKTPILTPAGHKANFLISKDKSSPVAISSASNSYQRLSTSGCEKERTGSLGRKEGSSSGSNDSGQSEPISSSTVATTCSSISSVYDSKIKRPSMLSQKNIDMSAYRPAEGPKQAKAA